MQPCLSSPLLNHGTNEPLPIGARVEAAAEKIEVNWAWGDRSETGFISEAISENESQVESKARTLIWKQRLGLTPTAKSLLRRTASDQRIPTVRISPYFNLTSKAYFWYFGCCFYS